MKNSEKNNIFFTMSNACETKRCFITRFWFNSYEKNNNKPLKLVMNKKNTKA